MNRLGLLVAVGLGEGRKLTSWSSLKSDLLNAGALWEDSEVVVDRNLGTSRSPKDLPAFCESLIRVIADVRR